MTRGKKGIVSVLEKTQEPLSVKQIREKIKTSPVPDMATLYRSLDLMVSLGIVREVTTGHGHSHYELAGTHHHHVICKKCGKIREVNVCIPSATEKKAASLSGMTILHHSLEFFGQCKKCPKKISC